ncbi:MAG: hypothetical protein WDN06_12805 [Asticcacaulis sp.]
MVKDIWSSSFVLVTCGLTTLVLAGLHVLLDNGKAPKNWLVLFPMAFGLNAIVAYVLDELCWALPGWNLIDLPYQWLKNLIYQPIAALTPVILYILLLWVGARLSPPSEMDRQDLDRRGHWPQGAAFEDGEVAEARDEAQAELALRLGRQGIGNCAEGASGASASFRWSTAGRRPRYRSSCRCPGTQ